MKDVDQGFDDREPPRDGGPPHGEPPDLRTIRRQLIVALASVGRRDESLELFRAELAGDSSGEAWLNGMIVDAIYRGDLGFAGELATVATAQHSGSEWYPKFSGRRPPPLSNEPLSVFKLRHDLAQLRYLRSLGELDDSFDDLIRGYADTVARAARIGPVPRISRTPEDDQRIGRAYGRIIHLARAGRVRAALSDTWDRQARPGVVVLDDFLTEPALERLYRFCLESTVWSSDREGGRLGSAFLTGFNCPLVLQIAEEIRETLPSLFGVYYPLRRLGAVKTTCDAPPDATTHIEPAAINVLLWLTPAEANLDDSSGGIVIYSSQRRRMIRVAYRPNRCVIFHADLMHASEAVRFRPDYASHRLEVSMQFGERPDRARGSSEWPTTRSKH